MQIDSRNPVVYYSGLQATTKHGSNYAFSSLQNIDIDNYEIQLITSVMYIDKFEVQCYEDQYVSLADYDKLKAKLENLERKHAKLQRRHERVGLSLMIARRMKKLFERKYSEAVFKLAEMRNNENIL
jgi:hypothetical protein